jgi:hypothetical protein
MPWYAGKGEIREYLQLLNKDGKVQQHTAAFRDYDDEDDTDFLV